MAAKKTKRVDDKVCPKCGARCLSVHYWNDFEFQAVHETEIKTAQGKLGPWTMVVFKRGCDSTGPIPRR